MIKFSASRPGAWLREDIADALTALALTASDDGYILALVQVAQILGCTAQPISTTAVTIDGNGREVTR